MSHVKSPDSFTWFGAVFSQEHEVTLINYKTGHQIMSTVLSTYMQSFCDRIYYYVYNFG